MCEGCPERLRGHSFAPKVEHHFLAQIIVAGQLLQRQRRTGSERCIIQYTLAEAVDGVDRCFVKCSERAFDACPEHGIGQRRILAQSFQQGFYEGVWTVCSPAIQSRQDLGESSANALAQL